MKQLEAIREQAEQDALTEGDRTEDYAAFHSIASVDDVIDAAIAQHIAADVEDERRAA